MKDCINLEGLPRIHYINLERSVERRKHIELQFKEWGIFQYERIAAIDGRDETYVKDALIGNVPSGMNFNEIACVMSHLKAMKYWLEQYDEELLMVMEDDCDISTANYWGFSWKDLMRELPYHWDVVQLAVINPAVLSMGLHSRFVNDYSTACYIIRRHHAEKLVKAHCLDGCFKLDQKLKPRAVADDLIYNSGFALAIAVFCFKINTDSTIHNDHYEVHKRSHDAAWSFWNDKAALIKDWKKFLSYNPYYGNIPPAMIEKNILRTSKKLDSSFL